MEHLAKDLEDHLKELEYIMEDLQHPWQPWNLLLLLPTLLQEMQDLGDLEYLLLLLCIRPISGGRMLDMLLKPLLLKEVQALLVPTNPLTRTSQPWAG